MPNWFYYHTHGPAAGDRFADPLFRLQGKDRLAGRARSGTGDRRSRNLVPCLIG